MNCVQLRKGIFKKLSQCLPKPETQSCHISITNNYIYIKKCPLHGRKTFIIFSYFDLFYKKRFKISFSVHKNKNFCSHEQKSNIFYLISFNFGYSSFLTYAKEILLNIYISSSCISIFDPNLYKQYKEFQSEPFFL